LGEPIEVPVLETLRTALRGILRVSNHLPLKRGFPGVLGPFEPL
jgi:hypothetical protein